MIRPSTEAKRACARGTSSSGYADFLASRPRGAENLAIAWLLERARWTGARAHVLHLSRSDALPMLASARRDGVAVTVETCPHYLTFTAEAVPDGAPSTGVARRSARRPTASSCGRAWPTA